MEQFLPSRATVQRALAAMVVLLFPRVLTIRRSSARMPPGIYMWRIPLTIEFDGYSLMGCKWRRSPACPRRARTIYSLYNQTTLTAPLRYCFWTLTRLLAVFVYRTPWLAMAPVTYTFRVTLRSSAFHPLIMAAL